MALFEIPELAQLLAEVGKLRTELSEVRTLLEEKTGTSKMQMKDAVDYTKISAATIKRDIKLGRKHPHKSGLIHLRAEVTRGGQYRFVRKDLDEFYSMFSTTGSAKRS